MSLGLDCERSKEIASVNSEVNSRVGSRADDFGRGQLVVRIEEVDVGRDAAGFGGRYKASNAIFARNAAQSCARNGCRLSVKVLMKKNDIDVRQELIDTCRERIGTQEPSVRPYIDGDVSL